MGSCGLDEIVEIVILPGEMAGDYRANRGAGEVSKATSVIGNAWYWPRRAVRFEDRKENIRSCGRHQSRVACEVNFSPVR